MRTFIGAGDSYVERGFLAEGEAAALFERISAEVDFQQWYHMPDAGGELRPLNRVKRALANPAPGGGVPWYRFTVNDQARHGVVVPMTPAVEELRARASAAAGVDFNHSVVLLYRDGDDSIGPHKDKTLDLDAAAPIVSVSLGATRTYRLQLNPRSLAGRQDFELPSGALVALGPRTNDEFYHAIVAGAAAGPRLSVTFRKVATFLGAGGALSGKGAEYQSLNWPAELGGRHADFPPRAL